MVLISFHKNVLLLFLFAALVFAAPISSSTTKQDSLDRQIDARPPKLATWAQDLSTRDGLEPRGRIKERVKRIKKRIKDWWEQMKHPGGERVALWQQLAERPKREYEYDEKGNITGAWDIYDETPKELWDYVSPVRRKGELRVKVPNPWRQYEDSGPHKKE